MTTATFLGRPRQRADGATLACIYVAAVAIIPSGLVVQGIPLSITPATLIGLGMAMCLMCAHLTRALGMATGRNPIRTALYFYVISLVATYAYANYEYLPSDEVNQADRTAILLLALVGVALLICDGVRTRDRVEAVLRAVAVAVAVVGLIGALQFVLDVDLTRYLVLPGLRYTAAADGSVFARSGFRRVSGTTGNPIEFGVLCAMTLPLPLHFGARARALGQRTWTWYVCSGLVASGLLFSVSRSAVLGVLSAGLVLLVAWPMRRRLAALVTSAVFLVVAKFAFPGLLNTFVSLFQNIGTDDSVAYRTHDYPVAEAEIARNFWFGHGVGTFYAPKYLVFDNQYLLTLVESGVVGFVALVGVFSTALVTALRIAVRSRTHIDRDLAVTLAACAIVPVVGSITFDLLSFRTLEGVFFVILGTIGALFRVSTAERRPPDLLAHPRGRGQAGEKSI